MIELDYAPGNGDNREYAAMVADQHFAMVDCFTLELGYQLRRAPVAYKTWGTLNEAHDNVLVLCHALSGSSDVEDWWGPLLGPGKAFDTSRYLVFCGNVIGSPYGTVSPLSTNPDTGFHYGPEFPDSTIRDDIRQVFIHLFSSVKPNIPHR